MTIQQEFEALGELVEGFVEREVDGALVFACGDVEVLYVAKILAGIDERDEADVVQVFTAPVGSVAGFVDSLVETIAAQRAAIDAQLDAEGRPRWPRLPEAARGGEPAARVLALLEWVRARMPAGDHRLVWGLVPVEIADRTGWARLGEELMRAAVQLEGVRLVLRDDAAGPELSAIAEAWPDERVLAYRIELDPGALVEAVAAIAKDPQQPPRDRMMALLQLAYLDLGHGRLAEARQKFSAIAEFFGRSGDRGLQALALGGEADAIGRAGDRNAARVQLDAALVLAARAGAWPVVLNHAISLGMLCRDAGTVVDAESYYQLAAVTAERMGNASAQADALEQVGALRLAQGDGEGAIERWGAAAQVCHTIRYEERLAAVLERMAPVHRAAGRAAAAQACEKAAAELRGEAAA